MSNNYADLRRIFQKDGTSLDRCAQRLLALRESLADLRKRNTKTSLLLATWNIRDFDSNKFGFGPRLPESFYYIAEILSCFDLVAVQEVNRDLGGWERLMRILGREWDYIVTDATEGFGGNDERMAFLYRRDKVWFRKIAGEVVLPDGQLVVSPRAVQPPTKQKAVAAVSTEKGQQFARTPFMVAFQSGWFRFSLCTVHIYYGKESGVQLKRRIAEIERLVEFFANRQDREAKAAAGGKSEAENYILLGDFNVVSPEHETMAALKSKSFEVPDAIDGRKVRKEGAHFYDQIAVRVKDPRFRVVTGGMLDPFLDVFRDIDEDRAAYDAFLPESDPEANSRYKVKSRADLYRKWRTWQMSDHSPLWIEIETDFSDDYLRKMSDGR